VSQALRARIVAEAWAWQGTKYHHHGRLKGVGVDCANLLAAVYEAAGAIGHVELGDYSPQWHQHHTRELFLEWLERLGARRLPEGQAPQAGDVGVWHYEKTFSHGGIVVEGGADPLVLHAYIGRRVVPTRCSEEPLRGVPACFWSIVE
jgi:cell wall-associated NlpC family hydrolase